MTNYYFKHHGTEGERLADIRKAVGDSIGRRRQRAGMTQEAVAEQLGIGPEAVSRMERGVGSVTAERLIVLAELFSCRADELLLQASHRPADQAGELATLLEGLPEGERLYLMDSIRNFCLYVAERGDAPR